jgi:hypothetical protein
MTPFQHTPAQAALRSAGRGWSGIISKLEYLSSLKESRKHPGKEHKEANE